ncbi:MAG: hypothetical protein R3247_04890 [Rhodothermales bacterium]|nr:hypothetical protein [Rhodothermales bacterium]
MTETTTTPSTDSAHPDGLAGTLERHVVENLVRAMQNAVDAQSQLFVLGQAALSVALQQRLSHLDEEDGPEEPDAEAPSVQDLAARLQHLAAGPHARPARSAMPDDLAQTTGRLMRSFAVALALLNEVNAQQMLNYVYVVLAAGVRMHAQDLGPADARILVDLLSGNRLVEFLADLEAEAPAASVPGG